MNNFFEYLDYRDLLKELIAERQKIDKWFSYRWISQKCGISSSGFLSLVLNGRRNISTETANSLCDVFHFTRKEKNYFLALVKYNQSADSIEKHEAFESLLLSRPLSVKSIRADQQEYYNHWYYSAIREMVAVFPDDDSVKHISDHLLPKVTITEVKDALALLERLEFISKKESGGYKRNDTLISSSGTEIEISVLRKYQGEMIDCAKDALYNIDKSDRDISTVTLSTNEEGLNLIRQRIEQCRAEIMTIAKSGINPDRILQLNLQLFPLCKKKGQV